MAKKLSNTTLMDIALDTQDYSFIQNIYAIANMPAESFQVDELQSINEKLNLAIKADDEQAVTQCALELEKVVISTDGTDDKIEQKINIMAKTIIQYGMKKYEEMLRRGY